MQTAARIRQRYSTQHILEAAAAILEDRVRSGEVMGCPDQVKSLIQLKLGVEEREHFGVLFLDTKHRMISFEIMFSGTLSQTSVYPREVARRALALNAAAVILAHNHPSGDTEASFADQALTKRLVEACQLVDVRVVDHVIVSPSETYSFAEKGLI